MPKLTENFCSFVDICAILLTIALILKLSTTPRLIAIIVREENQSPSIMLRNQFFIVITQLKTCSELQLLTVTVAWIFIRQDKLEDSSSISVCDFTKLWTSKLLRDEPEYWPRIFHLHCQSVTVVVTCLLQLFCGRRKIVDVYPIWHWLKHSNELIPLSGNYVWTIRVELTDVLDVCCSNWMRRHSTEATWSKMLHFTHYSTFDLSCCRAPYKPRMIT